MSIFLRDNRIADKVSGNFSYRALTIYCSAFFRSVGRSNRIVNKIADNAFNRTVFSIIDSSAGCRLTGAGKVSDDISR